MKKSIKIRASGHVVERKTVEKLIRIVTRSEGGDLRDIHISIPTIASGVGEKTTSFISFYLVHEEDKLKELYDQVIEVLEEDEFVILEGAREGKELCCK